MDENRNGKQNYTKSIEENYKEEKCKRNYKNNFQKIRDSESDYRVKPNNINSIPQRKQRTHSRSRSPHKSSKQWISSNAFINFIQDFSQNFTGVKSTKIFEMASKIWEKMSSDEKQPYIKAAMSIKNKKQNQQKIENINKLDNGIVQPRNEETQKQEKIGKKEKKENETKKSTKKKYDTESDSGSISSDTSGTNTNEDMST
ncbi:PREDICTED: uncharacterized protein LOC108545814 [Eufriesea mexicana]|uniref:uncharacterized protein LOC108545814 n=1 Tax=Eufriesea mexicana TaxID=516756 RepID=UPI00083C46FD|nr:PREDICTED: uncharacterized protein LOC108545814 [Eufriesea mexicana]